VDSINGTAKESEDYVKVKEIIEFKENEEEKQVRNLHKYIYIHIAQTRMHARTHLHIHTVYYISLL